MTELRRWNSAARLCHAGSTIPGLQESRVKCQISHPRAGVCGIGNRSRNAQCSGTRNSRQQFPGLELGHFGRSKRVSEREIRLNGAPLSSHPWAGVFVAGCGIGNRSRNAQSSETRNSRQQFPGLELGHFGRSKKVSEREIRLNGALCSSHPWAGVCAAGCGASSGIGKRSRNVQSSGTRNSRQQFPGLELGHWKQVSECVSAMRNSRQQFRGLELGHFGWSHGDSKRVSEREIRLNGSPRSSHPRAGVCVAGCGASSGIGNSSRNVQCSGTRNPRQQFLGLELGYFGRSHGDSKRVSEREIRLNGAPHFSSSRRPLVVRALGSDGPKSWFRRFLFESIEISDSDTDSDELEIPDFDEEVVEFEPRADGVSPESSDEVDEMLEDDRRFFKWKMKTEARNELRDFEASGRDPESKDWEDWLDDSWNQYEDNLQGGEDGWYEASPNWDKDGVPREPPTKPERGMKRTIKELLFRILEPEDEVEEDLQFEERVFRFTSRTTAKFVGVLVIVPWITDFIIHDFVLAPFLETYVEKVPLAAKVLDIRESQKLKIIEALKLERQRLRFEAEIGKAPPLSDDELSEHIREEALELREEFRLENRQAFASIWSDFAAGLTILLLLLFNPKQVGIMRLTGERLFTNISDTGKAFIIILLTDIFLGYHSESGWETVSEMVLEHYGIEVPQAAIYTFVAIVPVTIDACFKLWVFRFFRTISPSASATFREMQRH